MESQQNILLASTDANNYLTTSEEADIHRVCWHETLKISVLLKC